MRIALTLLISLMGSSALAHAGHIAESGGHSHGAFYAGLVLILLASVGVVTRRRLALMKGAA